MTEKKTCLYSFAPHGRTGNTAIFCHRCSFIVSIVPDVSEARELIEKWSQDPAPCHIDEIGEE